jgi:hypothetical protein
MIIDLTKIKSEDKLLEREEEIKKLETEQKDLVNKQRESFGQTVREMYPLLKFLVERSYGFRNPKIESYIIYKGPLLDKIDNELYFWDAETQNLKKIDIHTQKEQNISGFLFFEDCDFENVKAGLEYSLTLQDVHFDHLQRDIATRKKSLENM